MIIVAIEILLLGIVGLFFLYLALLSILAFFRHNRKELSASRLHRFAIVVPAHNEELTIEKTLKNLIAVNYPRKHFDVVVIADNCTDRTAEVAREHGAIVYERTNSNLRGKGHALRWCFDILMSHQPSYDAFVVIDADSVAAANFLLVMNWYLENGSTVIQASDLVEPRPGVWSSEVIRLGFTLYNYVRPLGRSALRCSTGLRGNGMCFAREIFEKFPWNTYSLNEDLEYSLQLLLNGFTVDFAPEAQVLATMPSSARHAQSQRMRWEKGRFPIIQKYSLPLLRNAITNLSLKSFDAFLDLVTPPLVNLFSFVSLMFTVTLFLWLFGIAGMGSFTILWALIIFLGLIHVFVGLRAAKADRSLYRSFLYIPRYAVWKLGVYMNIVRDVRSQEWIRTTRESSTDIENVIATNKSINLHTPIKEG
ncbi:MAG: glycosyltransferase family 2 protein [Ignavibacteriae bacterium]|nr:glycosyltransferase family 2 protein [Ignavibacteriota bacterium]